MKKLNYLLAIACISAFTFTSCEKDEIIKEIEVPVEVEISRDVQRISFENVSLNAEGYQNNFGTDSLTLSDILFYNSYSETYFSWEGFAVSNNTDSITAGYANEYSVYDISGANGSEKFAVAYSGFNQTTNCHFPSSQEYKFKSLMINNSTLAALSIKNGDAYAKQFTTGDWFKIIITAYNTNGTSTGSVEYYLADFRDGKSYICHDWTKVDLTSLEKANKLTFTFESTDNGQFGMNTPAYACIDDIIYYVD